MPGSARCRARRSSTPTGAATRSSTGRTRRRSCRRRSGRGSPSGGGACAPARSAGTTSTARRVDAVRAQLRDEGPLTTKDLGGAKASAEWWDWSEAKIAVEWLLDVGEVVCVERRGWRRVYDLAERAIPADLLREEPTEEACSTRLVAQGGRAMGVATRSDLADYHRLLLDQVDGGDRGDRPRAGDGRGLGRADAWADPAALETPVRGRHRTTLLSPFDSLIWDRKRTTRIFGFEHRIEAYVPKPKRVHGYYAMPLPRRAAISSAGSTPSATGRTLHAVQVSVEPQRDRQDGGALREAAEWVGCDAVALGRVDSARRRRRRFGPRSTGRGPRVPGDRTAPYTGDGVPRRACATAARSGSTASGSRTSRRTRRSATRRARSARLYDAMHDPRPARPAHAVDRHGIRTHRFFMPAYSAAGPARVARGDRALVAHVATATWAARRTTRPSFMATLGADPGAGTSRSPTAAAHWYREYAREALFLNHVLINPPIDRNKAVHEVEDVYVHVVERARRRDRRQRREDARDRLGAHARDVRRPEQRRPTSRRARPRTTRSCFIAPMDTPGKKLRLPRAPTRRHARSAVR